MVGLLMMVEYLLEKEASIKRKAQREFRPSHRDISVNPSLLAVINR
jgi:hypothetical protein